MIRFYSLLIVSLTVFTASLGFAEDKAKDAKQDTPEKFAQRYFDALNNGDKEAYKRMWVTEAQLRGFLEQMIKEQPVPKKFDIDEYITKSMEQAPSRMERVLRHIGKKKFNFEIVSVTPKRMDKTGVMCNGLEIVQRDLDTEEERKGGLNQEMLLYEGRWYFFERP